MAENKKSFLLYCDLIHTVEKMPKEKAGELLLHILKYVNDLEPETDDLIIQLTFEPIKQSLKRDLERWYQTKEGRSIAGKASAEAKRLAKLAEQNSTNSTNVENVQQMSTNSTVSDSVSVSVINNNTPAKADAVFDFNKYLETVNVKFGRSFQVVNEKTKKQIKARLKENYTKQDIIDAINNCKDSDFHKDNNYRYCTPEFFSRADILDRWSDVTKPTKPKVNIEL